MGDTGQGAAFQPSYELVLYELNTLRADTHQAFKDLAKGSDAEQFAASPLKSLYNSFTRVRQSYEKVTAYGSEELAASEAQVHDVQKGLSGIDPSSLPDERWRNLHQRMGHELATALYLWRTVRGEDASSFQISDKGWETAYAAGIPCPPRTKPPASSSHQPGLDSAATSSSQHSVAPTHELDSQSSCPASGSEPNSPIIPRSASKRNRRLAKAGEVASVFSAIPLVGNHTHHAMLRPMADDQGSDTDDEQKATTRGTKDSLVLQPAPEVTVVQGADTLAQLEAVLDRAEREQACSSYYHDTSGQRNRLAHVDSAVSQHTGDPPTEHNSTTELATQPDTTTQATTPHTGTSAKEGTSGEEEDTKRYRKMRYWDEVSNQNDVRVELLKDAEGRTVGVSWGTFNRLVEVYTWYFGASETFQRTNFDYPKSMLRSHLWFTTSQELLDKLVEVYHVPPGHKDPQRIRHAVCQGLRFWMQRQFTDFLVPGWLETGTGSSDLMAPDMKERLERFFATLKEHNENHMADLLEATVQKLLQYCQDRRDKLRPTTNIMPTTSNDSTPTEKPDFETVNLDQFAEQLTLLEFENFHAIQMRDLKAKLWTREDPKCPVMRMITHFNAVSTWVVHSIVVQDTPEKRARYIDRFRQLACILKDTCNFNTMMAIDGALQHTAVERLKRTFDELSDRKKAALAGLKAFTSPFHNYAHYRRAQSERNGFCIPYIGLYLRDLIHTEDGQPTWINGGGIVSFTKMATIAENALEIQRCQEIVPTFERDQKSMEVVASFLHLPGIKEDDLYRISKEVEPRLPAGVAPPKSPQPTATSGNTGGGMGADWQFSIRRKRDKDDSARKTQKGAEDVDKMATCLLLRYAHTDPTCLNKQEQDAMRAELAEFRDYDPFDKEAPAVMDRGYLVSSLLALYNTANTKKTFTTLGKSKTKGKAQKILLQLYPLVEPQGVVGASVSVGGGAPLSPTLSFGRIESGNFSGMEDEEHESNSENSRPGSPLTPTSHEGRKVDGPGSPLSPKVAETKVGRSQFHM